MRQKLPEVACKPKRRKTATPQRLSGTWRFGGALAAIRKLGACCGSCTRALTRNTLLQRFPTQGCHLQRRDGSLKCGSLLQRKPWYRCHGPQHQRETETIRDTGQRRRCLAGGPPGKSWPSWRSSTTGCVAQELHQTCGKVETRTVRSKVCRSASATAAGAPCHREPWATSQKASCLRLAWSPRLQRHVQTGSRSMRMASTQSTERSSRSCAWPSGTSSSALLRSTDRKKMILGQARQRPPSTGRRWSSATKLTATSRTSTSSWN
mmetsp:Transcript_71529/g.115435  ORF Transcript_71529/g.115435 Transcript_71529/m.115435 type:complete len:265 (-) Transcript_71529:227-1021(-)